MLNFLHVHWPVARIARLKTKISITLLPCSSGEMKKTKDTYPQLKERQISIFRTYLLYWTFQLLSSLKDGLVPNVTEDVIAVIDLSSIKLWTDDKFVSDFLMFVSSSCLLEKEGNWNLCLWCWNCSCYPART